MRYRRSAEGDTQTHDKSTTAKPIIDPRPHPRPPPKFTENQAEFGLFIPQEMNGFGQNMKQT